MREDRSNKKDDDSSDDDDDEDDSRKQTVIKHELCRKGHHEGNPNKLLFQKWILTAESLNTARPEWTAGQVQIGAASDFRLVLEGKATNGGFAIDQLVFTPGKCKSK